MDSCSPEPIHIPTLSLNVFVCYSMAKSCPTLWPQGLKHSRLPCSSPSFCDCSNSCPSSRWCHPTISSSVVPFSSCLPCFPASGSFPVPVFPSYLNHVAKVLELQHQSFQWIFRIDFLYELLVWSPCSPRDFQESSPTPQFKSISSSVLIFLYGPTLTSIHGYWKKHTGNWGRLF